MSQYPQRLNDGGEVLRKINPLLDAIMEVAASTRDKVYIYNVSRAVGNIRHQTKIRI